MQLKIESRVQFSIHGFCLRSNKIKLNISLSGFNQLGVKFHKTTFLLFHVNNFSSDFEENLFVLNIWQYLYVQSYLEIVAVQQIITYDISACVLQMSFHDDALTLAALNYLYLHQLHQLCIMRHGKDDGRMRMLPSAAIALHCSQFPSMTSTLAL